MHLPVRGLRLLLRLKCAAADFDLGRRSFWWVPGAQAADTSGPGGRPCGFESRHRLRVGVAEWKTRLDMCRRRLLISGTLLLLRLSRTTNEFGGIHHGAI